ncbi:hypothetical protein [Pontivivens ytuae]|uniref:Uncharacterized protein n=1 Tax=Pontivivens ytuae TaxID=2789856 RepID=A0A7S9LPJ5_9RHOB|nr:hypothetical protein [Pontivivens ytuae]QPH52736.1 hypothetical protein I0K15_13055 [Pontivivens ytuae]
MLSMFSGSLSAALLAMTLALVAIGAVQTPSGGAASAEDPAAVGAPES